MFARAANGSNAVALINLMNVFFIFSICLFLSSNEAFQEPRAIPVYEGKRPFSFPKAQNADKRRQGKRLSKKGTILRPAQSRIPLKSLERVKGIEPSSQAWEARILPLNHTRTGFLAYSR
jgi:hypothetical protein